MQANVTRLVPHAQMPTRDHGSVGYDIFSAEGYVVLPGERAVVSTGIKIKIPDGFYGVLVPKTGITIKHGIEVGAGIVEPGYDGELKVVLFNHDRKHNFVIRPGYRVAQLILCPYAIPELVESI